MSQEKETSPRPLGRGSAQPNERPAAPPAGDARHDARKQAQNRKHLGVDEDHATPAMKKGHRGTFP